MDLGCTSEPTGLKVGSGKARSLPCQRVLTVGTDMAIGKMSTSLELQKASRARGLRSQFIATGQAGIMIAGDGVPWMPCGWTLPLVRSSK